jgi:acetoin utilization protein AcuC
MIFAKRLAAAILTVQQANADAVMKDIALVSGPEIAAYGFGEGHPFGPDRHDVFLAELKTSPVAATLARHRPRQASRDELRLFHTPHYIDRVEQLSASGEGFLDAGDTPAYAGVFSDASYVVGAALVALEVIMAGPVRRAFVPIAGLHHAGRGHAAGFCVFNDCGVVIEAALQHFGLEQVAYVDIDAHHGDGVYYGFESDPRVLFADIHEDGRYLYPGTGARSETGSGAAAGCKLNIPLAPGADDGVFHHAWQEVESYLQQGQPELVVFQCGADSLAGDPITHLQFSEQAHGHGASRLAALAAGWGDVPILAVGGGGYNRRNLARAWTRVVEGLAELGQERVEI